MLHSRLSMHDDMAVMWQLQAGCIYLLLVKVNLYMLDVCMNVVAGMHNQ